MGEGEGAGEESSAVIERSKDWNGVAERAVRKSHPRHEDVELPVSLKVPHDHLVRSSK